MGGPLLYSDFSTKLNCLGQHSEFAGGSFLDKAVKSLFKFLDQTHFYLGKPVCFWRGWECWECCKVWLADQVCEGHHYTFVCNVKKLLLI